MVRLPVSPVEVPNGTFATLASSPLSTGLLGAALLNVSYTFYPSQISDNGPNNGFWYNAAFTDTSTHRYEISPDLENTSSTFYGAQCGNYDPVNRPAGFISGSVLLSNTQQHEFGTVLGHYQQYVAALNDPANNLGFGAEQEIGGPGTARILLRDK